ncbi:MAG: MiaB/RimO family radical SAM methylthiotransferase [Acidobacteria bacterium]|jgi:threonylcarbamoyladenosine tRNA methylthiotransferase MtaB|nr:MiaB/RimO family radical SAM methylthiotransferase [Acidobacteriota bacterium]
MKFVVECFGCRSNQAEVQEWIVELEGRGYELTTRAAEATFGILNTCSVTEKAEKDVLRFIGRTYRHTGVPWLVAGCTVSRERAGLDQKYRSYFFFDNREKQRLVETACELFPVDSRLIYHSAFRSRVFLKVQDGCNFRCSFCIVPALRGKARSLEPKEVLAKARRYAGLGYREVVLTGINLSSYGYDLFPRQTLLDLVAALQHVRGVEIIRLSSLDPRFIRYHFIKELAAMPKVADSFHFSLQSGSDAVIRRMNRGSRGAEYLRILSHFRDYFPEANLGADFIAGFPGESERQFQETVAFIQAAPLNYLHVFPFSPRPGTKAATLEPLPPPVLRARAAELKDLGSQMKLAYRDRCRGKIFSGILIEENPHYALVVTRNFLSVRVPPLRGFKKRKLHVRVERVVNENLCEGKIA